MKHKLKLLSPGQLAYLKLLKDNHTSGRDQNDGTDSVMEAVKLTFKDGFAAAVDKVWEWMLKKDSCIQGMACPGCGQSESFIIKVPVLLEFEDDGETAEEPQGQDRFWDDESYCRCPQCGHEGEVLNFSADCPACNGDGCSECGGTGLRHPDEGPYIKPESKRT